MNLDGWSLHLAKERGTEQVYLAIANMDTDEVRILATFENEYAVDVYTTYMEQNGWLALALPTQDDINSLLDE